MTQQSVLFQQERQPKLKQDITQVVKMKKEYDLGKLKSRKNPFSKQLKKQVTLRMGVDVLDYFKEMSEETGIPYQNLINLYLRECVNSKRKISFQ